MIALYASYIIPVFLDLKAGHRGAALTRGPVHLGRYGRAINVFAIVWVALISIVLSLPDGMRSGKTILGLLAFLSIWYVLSKRRTFRGPAFAE